MLEFSEAGGDAHESKAGAFLSLVQVVLRASDLRSVARCCRLREPAPTLTKLVQALALIDGGKR